MAEAEEIPLDGSQTTVPLDGSQNTVPLDGSQTSAATTTTTTNDAEPPPPPIPIKPAPLEHGFVAGDHVIRWEMLPIAWPIQIHGIVLNVSDAGVVLVDFGLAASHQQQQQQEQQPPQPSEAEEGATTEGDEPKKGRPSFFSANGQKEMERKIHNSFRKLNPTHEKQRLNVLVLDDPNEIKSWRKVNYDGGLFGFGGGNNHGGEDAPSEKATLASEAAATSGGSNRKLGKWWNSFTNKGKKAPPTTDADAHDDAATVDSAATADDASADGRRPWWRRSSLSNSSNAAAAAATAAPIAEEEEAAGDAKENEEEEAAPQTPAPDTTASPPPQEEEEEEATKEEAAAAKSAAPVTPSKPAATDEPPAASPLSQRAMNPAMAKLLESKKASEPGPAAPPKKEDSKKKAPDLPKADPPKLVLARTRWLLQHGEDVLPPYHAFHSNSECIAVFCKTGHWSNLQADVFLHSTAIGNAKTMGAATIGVAASAPFLAPVIAGLGIGMVAAPWLLLHSSKQNQVDFTQQMTDNFWAQAEPEVFVECIEHWSKLDEYHQAKEAQQKKAEEEPAATTDDDAPAPSSSGDDGEAPAQPKVVTL